MTRIHSTAGVFAAFFLGAHAVAQTPELSRIEPFSGTVGESVAFLLEGKNLADTRTLWTDFHAKARDLPSEKSAGNKPDPTKLAGTLVLPEHPTAPVGFLYLSTATGLSNPLLFLVDDLPVLRKKASNKRSDAVALPLPHAVAGHTDTGESRFFRIDLSANNPVSIEVYAARIASKLDPRLRVLDSDGTVHAFSDDSPGLAGDCRLRFIPPKSGVYLIELRDSAFNGGPDYRYHLRVGDFPLVSAVYPPVASVDSEPEFTALEPAGVSTMPPLRIRIPSSAHATVPAPFRFGPQNPAALTTVRATSFPVVVEPLDASGSHAAKAAVDTPLPEQCVVVGRLTTPGERDTYPLKLRKDDRIQIDPLNREIGSSVSLYLAVRGEDGRVMASNDSPGNPPQDADLPLSFKAPKDGTYTLEIEDTCRRGSPSLVYAVQAVTNPAPFDVSVTSNRFIAPKGGSFSAKVSLARKGMNEAVTVSMETADQKPLPDGIRLENALIEKGKNETLLHVTLPLDLPEGTLRHFQLRASPAAQSTCRSALASPQTDNKKNNGKKNEPLTAALAAMPQPPRLLTESLLFCVGPEAPDFFRIELTDRGALLPRMIGKSQFVLRQSAIEKDFATPVQLQFENLPEGFSVTHSGGRGGRIAGQVDFVCEIQGPQTPPANPISFDIVASADFKGAYKQVRLSKVPIGVVDPVEIHATPLTAPLRPGSSGTLRIQVTRHDPANPAPVELRVEDLPAGIALSAPPRTLPVGESSLEIPLTVAPDAPEGATETLHVTATSTVAGKLVSSTSSRVRVEIKK
jgi:hypothetical protein